MKEILFLQGIKFGIYTIMFDDDYCPTLSFLERLRKNDSSSCKTLLNLLKLHADYGPVRNERKSKKSMAMITCSNSKQPMETGLYVFIALVEKQSSPMVFIKPLIKLISSNIKNRNL